MAKKVTPKSDTPAAMPPTDPAPSVAKASSTKPRGTTSPAAPAVMPDPIAVTDEMIADRAYFKWKNGEPGDPHHHWVSSERELRGHA